MLWLLRGDVLNFNGCKLIVNLHRLPSRHLPIKHGQFDLHGLHGWHILDDNGLASFQRVHELRCGQVSGICRRSELFELCCGLISAEFWISGLCGLCTWQIFSQPRLVHIFQLCKLQHGHVPGGHGRNVVCVLSCRNQPAINRCINVNTMRAMCFWQVPSPHRSIDLFGLPLRYLLDHHGRPIVYRLLELLCGQVLQRGRYLVHELRSRHICPVNQIVQLHKLQPWHLPHHHRC